MSSTSHRPFPLEGAAPSAPSRAGGDAGVVCWGVAFFLLALVLGGAAYASPDAARDYLASVRPSPALQQFLDRTVDALLAADPALRRAAIRVALLDLSHGAPRLAHRAGDVPIYPASVVKFVYLMAAYAWQEQGKRRIDPELDAWLTEMIRASSNRATQQVFARLTDTTPGPELDPGAYAIFKARRLSVDAWLRTLGVTDLHCVNPTYDGDGDLVGRDRQFLRDSGVDGALPSRGDELRNRNAMTAIGTAKLLALLATDRALSPADSAAVRARMRRDPTEQPHLAARIAGGAARLPGLQVYAKSGTWGPIYADAGIVRDAAGRQFILAVFSEASPPYRGTFIAELTHRSAVHLFR
jgi:beta-lactamase class A